MITGVRCSGNSVAGACQGGQSVAICPVVWKLDRRARSTRQLLEPVEALQRREMGLRILTQNIDTASVGGRLILTVVSAIAEFEREIIRGRARAGLDTRSRGRKGGRPRALSDKDLKQACALLADPEMTVEDVAAGLALVPLRCIAICLRQDKKLKRSKLRSLVFADDQ